jgi:hypothetical protein
MVIYGAGTAFYYAGEEGATGYKSDHIALRGMVQCAPVATKLVNDAGAVLRASQKPVSLLQYIVTTMVRASTPRLLRACVRCACPCNALARACLFALSVVAELVYIGARGLSSGGPVLRDGLCG